MADQHLLLDAFADVRRTWDDLVTLQPDIVSAGGALTLRELREINRRLGAHREAVDRLADSLDAVRGEPAHPIAGPE